MSDPRYDDRPRIYFNWDKARPTTLRGWAAAVGFIAIALGILALIAVVASTVLAIALVAVVIGGAWFAITSLFRPRRRDVGPYRGD
jgi:uncharacterized membrane protein HdeD (DUF308 family)